jgi:hypothetical protein
MDGLLLVEMNGQRLRDSGGYERALLYALTMARVNAHGYRLDQILKLVKHADRVHLRAAGDPLPGPGPFTVYRGVAGRGAARRVRGLSWTTLAERARWFADRYGKYLHDPAVYRVTIQETSVLAYSNAREEQEFVVQLPADAKPERVVGVGVGGRAM